MKQACRSYLLLLTLLLTTFASAHAASITQTYSGALPVTLTGSLPDQGTALEQTFTLASPGDLTIFTSSYATGGFQTNLLLFDATGSFITASIPGGQVDPGTGSIGDSILMVSNLSAGVYTVALTDFLLGQSLTATNLSDGFGLNFGDGNAFVDANGNSRSANYALTISNPAPIPEPSTFLLAAPVVAWFALRKRKLSNGEHAR